MPVILPRNQRLYRLTREHFAQGKLTGRIVGFTRPDRLGGVILGARLQFDGIAFQIDRRERLDLPMVVEHPGIVNYGSAYDLNFGVEAELELDGDHLIMSVPVRGDARRWPIDVAEKSAVVIAHTCDPHPVTPAFRASMSGVYFSDGVFWIDYHPMICGVKTQHTLKQFDVTIFIDTLTDHERSRLLHFAEPIPEPCRPRCFVLAADARGSMKWSEAGFRAYSDLVAMREAIVTL